MSKPVIRLSTSQLNMLETCPRKYWISNILDWPEYSDKSPSLAAMSGTAIHEYIQALYAGKSRDEAMFAVFKIWDFSVEDVANEYNKNNRGFAATIITAEAAANELNISPVNLASVDGKPAIEVVFAIKFEHKDWKADYAYISRIDLIEFDSFTHRYTVADIKTHRSTIQDRTPQYKYNQQLIPYGIILQSLLGKDTSAFTVKYIDIYTDTVEPKVNTYSFPKTKADIDAWYQRILRVIRDTEDYLTTGIWPRTGIGCINYNRPCRLFKDYCGIEDAQTLQDFILQGKEPAERKEVDEPWVEVTIKIG